MRSLTLIILQQTSLIDWAEVLEKACYRLDRKSSKQLLINLTKTIKS